MIHYDDKEYEDYCGLEDGTLKNLGTVNAYIYSQNGAYDIYRTELGEFYMSENNEVLCGNLGIKYRGKIYNIIINNMYGMNALTILRLQGEKVGGWCNIDGQGSPSNSTRTEELEDDIIEKVFNRDITNYGDSVHKFIDKAKEMYYKDKTNYILTKCFNM